jgi:hypothetical protein
MSFVVAAALRPASVAEAEVGSNGLGPPRTHAAAAVAISFVVAAASRPASVAEEEVGSNGLGPSRSPAAAVVVVVPFVVVFIALRRAA